MWQGCIRVRVFGTAPLNAPGAFKTLGCIVLSTRCGPGRPEDSPRSVIRLNIFSGTNSPAATLNLGSVSLHAARLGRSQAWLNSTRTNDPCWTQMNYIQVKRQFGSAIRQLRRERGVSQESLARKARLARTYLTGVEMGVRNPTLQNISRLANALGVPIAELFQ